MYMYNTDPQELVCAARYGNLEQVKRCLSDSLEDCLESHCTFDVMMKNTDSLLLEQVPAIHMQHRPDLKTKLCSGTGKARPKLGHLCTY
jgi:hypothetical protein